MDTNQISKDNVQHITKKFLELAATLKESKGIERIQPKLQQYKLGLFRLVIIGEIKKGKTRFINALLSRPDLLPVHSDVATSTVYKVMYGDVEKYKVFFLPKAANQAKENLTPLEISREQLAEYGTEDGNPGNQKMVDFIGVQLPHPFLKSGLVIIDTPGLGGLFRKHSDITWRYIPNADAIFFVLDSVEAVASQEEMECLQKLREMTPRLFFVQTKTDIVSTEQWQQWRDRNLDIIGKKLNVSAKKFIYFPVSSKLKEIADKESSPKDLNESGFVSLLYFLHNKLLKSKEEQLARSLLTAIALETANIRRRLTDEFQILNTETKEGLDALEREFIETKTRLAKWQETEYRQIVTFFQDQNTDLRRQISEHLQDRIDISPQGPIIRPIIDELRHGHYSAKQIDKQAGAIQSDCIDKCNREMMEILGQYNRKANDLICEAARQLNASIPKDSIVKTTKQISIPSAESLNVHVSQFETVRNALYGGLAGGMIGDILVSIIAPPLAPAIMALALCEIGGMIAAGRHLKAKRKEEALIKLQNLLVDTVRFAQRQATHQFQESATAFERNARQTFENAAAETQKELQAKLESVANARQRAAEENRSKASALKKTLQSVDELLRSLGQAIGSVSQAASGANYVKS